MSLTGKEWVRVVNAVANASVGHSPGFGILVRLDDVLRTLKLHSEDGTFFEVGPEGKVVFGFRPKELQQQK